MEVLFDTKSNSLLLLWENLQLFMKVWTWKQHIKLNISDRSFEDVIDVLEETLRDFEVEELDIIEIIDKAKSLKKR